MERRSFLVSLTPFLSLAMSGCLSDLNDADSETSDNSTNSSNAGTSLDETDADDESDANPARACPEGVTPTAEIHAPTLAPGDTGTVRIETQYVESITWTMPGEWGDGVRIDWDEPEKVDPPIIMILESYPPIWRFGECVDAEIELLVNVEDNAEPGIYEFDMRISPDHQRGDWEIFDAAIQIE